MPVGLSGLTSLFAAVGSAGFATISQESEGAGDADLTDDGVLDLDVCQQEQGTL